MPKQVMPVPQEIQAAVRAAYQHLRNGGLRNRPGQRAMIAQAALAAANARRDPIQPVSSASFVVIQGPTGSGKSMGYAIPAIACGEKLQLTTVIATATVALQEQLARGDLPKLAEAFPKMRVAIAKGRGRYLCPKRMAAASLGGELSAEEEMTCAGWSLGLAQRQWEGDIDSLPKQPSEALWCKVKADPGDFSGRNCPDFNACPFYAAKAAVEQATVIVTNHDLLLTEALHESTMLPNLGQCLLVVDEAHGLPRTALTMMEERHAVHAVSAWGEFGQGTLSRCIRAGCGSLAVAARTAASELSRYQAGILYAQRTLEAMILSKGQEKEQVQGEPLIVNLPGGRLPPSLSGHAVTCAEAASDLKSAVDEVLKVLTGEESAELTPKLRDELSGLVSGLRQRCHEASAAWGQFARTPTDEEPIAKWLETDHEGELRIHVNASPLLANRGLYDKLWSKVAAGIVCSATLKTVGGFEPYLFRSGLDLVGDVATLDLPAPFDYEKQARLVVPNMRHTPKDAGWEQESTDLIVEALKRVPKGRGALMLFTSWARLHKVVESLPVQIRNDCLVQGEQAKAEMLRLHRERIEAGARSILIGTASLEEGVDLPGRQCELTIIDKIPFSVPTHPVELARMEWMRGQGRDHFKEVILPTASERLQQGCGRLIRTETDRGTVLLMDKRLMTTRYGSELRETLPAFKLTRDLADICWS